MNLPTPNVLTGASALTNSRMRSGVRPPVMTIST